MGVELFNRAEIGSIFGISVKTVYRYEKSGLITPAFHVGRSPRFAIEELEKIAKVKVEQIQKCQNSKS
jgi:predicted site-specific integrase-resolvase